MNSNIKNRLGWSRNEQRNVNYNSRNNNRQCHRLPNFKIKRNGQRNNNGRNNRTANQNQRRQNPVENLIRNPVVVIPANHSATVNCQCHCATHAPPVVDSCISMYTTVPLIVYGNSLIAALSCGSTFTKIGKHVANVAIRNNCAQTTRVFDHHGVRKSVKMLSIPMGVRTGRTKPIECIVDRFAPPMGIILGLAGMKTLSYRITIDRVVADHHGPGASIDQQNRSLQSADSRRRQSEEDGFEEGDFIEALTEAELREIDNWEKE